MAKTLKELAANCRKTSKELEQAASDRAVLVAETILADLEVKTPVDTTKALSNWQVTLNDGAVTYIPAHVPGKFGSTWQQSIDVAWALAKKVLLNKKPGDTIHIKNNAPYIKRLNEGYSSQAPAGFVERSVLIGRKLTNKVKIKIKV